jgi:hypothetical protein
MVITYEFFEKLINEKTNRDDFKVVYRYNQDKMYSLDFISGDYYATLLQVDDGVVFSEKKLKDGEFDVINSKIVYDARFHKDTLRDLEGILKKLSKKYECLHKKADWSIGGITETHSFVI